MAVSKYVTKPNSMFSLRPADDSGADGAGRGSPRVPAAWAALGERNREAAPAPDKAPPRNAAGAGNPLAYWRQQFSCLFAFWGRVPLPGV